MSDKKPPNGIGPLNFEAVRTEELSVIHSKRRTEQSGQKENRNIAHIMVFRIQNHLRQMGLGRQGILALMSHFEGSHDVKEAIESEYLEDLKARWPNDFTDDNINRFREIFQECDQQFKE